MKTQILQLEPHDDLNSTRDKIGWGQTGRILLVWPGRGRLLAHRLDLVLLLRYCQALGTQLALITRDPDVRAHARDLNISVFTDPRQAQEARWKRSSAPGITSRHPEAERRNYLRTYQPITQGTILPPSIRFGFFSLGLLAVIFIVAAIFPSAEIYLTPKTQTQEMTFRVIGKTSARQVNLTGVVPLRVKRVLVEGRDSLEPDGQTSAALNFAQGNVRFTNLSAEIISIPSGTIVSTLDGTLRFATTEDAWLARSPGSSASVPVIAVIPGSQSNLPAGRIQSIQGPLGPDLTATNPAALTGGSELLSPAPTPADREKLRQRLQTSLQTSALAEIRSILGSQDLLLSQSLTLVNVLEEIYTPAGDQPANRLELSLRLEYEALYMAAEDLEFLASSILASDPPAGTKIIPNSLQIETSSPAVLQEQTEAHLEIKASQSLQAEFPAEQPAYLVAGLTPSQARQRLEQYLPISGPLEIAIHPRWWPRLPLLPFRIELYRENPGN